MRRPKGNPSKKRERGRVLAVDGHHFIGSNNQLIVGIHDTLNID
jgi:hypothetical protein